MVPPVRLSSSARSPGADGSSFFFALLPDERAREAIARSSARFRQSHRLIGTPVGDAEVHLALCPAGRAENLFQTLESSLIAAGDSVDEKGFEVTLDTAVRLSMHDGQFPFVLCCDSASSEATLKLRKAIAAAQVALDLRVLGVSSYLPHVALLRGSSIDVIEQPIPPISWSVQGFSLMRSFFNYSRHEVVKRWALAPRF